MKLWLSMAVGCVSLAPWAGAQCVAPAPGKVELDGKPFTRSWISDAEIRKGGTLRFTMQAAPNKVWGQAAGARPYSMSTAR